MKRSRAVFLDRDGVINEINFDREHGVLETPATPREFRLKPGVGPAIRRLNRLGMKAVVVSNQPGVAMRRFTRQSLARVTEKMERDLRRSGARLDAVYYCLHHPVKGKGALKRRCGCRKPKAGLLFRAARELGIDLKRSYLVGDSIRDIQAGRRAGCRTFLTAHLKCDLCHLMARRGVKPHFLVKDLREAVRRLTRLESR